MLAQVLRGGSLRDAVSEVRTGYARRGEDTPAVSTGSYSDARQRLGVDAIEAVDRRVRERLVAVDSLVPGTRVIGVDATSVQLPDTSANQDHFPPAFQSVPRMWIPGHAIGGDVRPRYRSFGGRHPQSAQCP